MFTFDINENIRLRPLHLFDAREVFELTDRSRVYLREWLPWVDQTRTIRDSEEFIQRAEDMFTRQIGLTLGIFYQGRLAGVVAFNYVDWANRIGAIGYWLGQDFQGHGIMTQAVETLIDYGFYQLGLNRIEIRAAYENTKSRAIPERLGFQQEGQIRQGEWLYNHFVDLVVYGMLAGEWETRRI
ncbi:GNAT family N-acetyltransferase [Ornithinibacillus contaminans]|uniref:GNAT family N-acetyltransferase n=1 Tax=Ornithinibacillus contaminans TaxID=694055 RepID=UPI00064DB248|nr:GNAT family protein [Ornithinibacillus contaminans]